jgi:hypothetical protein
MQAIYQEGVLEKIVSAITALLIGVSGWLIITGRHERYYSRLRRRLERMPPELRSRWNGKSKRPHR